MEGADSVLESKNYVLCAVKFVNPWQATYLRRGVDVITSADGTQTTEVRHAQYVENDELMNLTTLGFNAAAMNVSLKDASGKATTCKLQLLFNGNECKISALTEGFTADGSGSFVEKGEKQSMGGKDRNALYLKYTVSSAALGKSVTTTDTLVVRDRGIAPEYFTPKDK